METVLRDVHHGLRMLARNPAFTAVAVITLALGIGASVANFSVVRGVLLRPLSYHDPERLVQVYDANPARDANQSAFSPQDLDDFSRLQDVFTDLAGYWYSPGASGTTLTGEGDPTYLETAFVGDGFFRTMGVAPSLGRSFRPEENVVGKDGVAILSYGLWRRQFHSDPHVLGHKVVLGGAPSVVVGVMPESFEFPSRQVAVWLPLSKITDHAIPHLRGLRWISVVARLKSGVSVPQASIASSVVLKRLEQQYPDTNTGWNHALAVDMRDNIVAQVKPALLALFAAGMLVLLMGSANLANLLLAQGTVRQREFAIRSALGGDRWRLRRQLLTENIVVSCIGGAAAFALAPRISSVLLMLSAGSIPRPDAVQMDRTVVLFGVGLTLISGVLIGAIPAARVAGDRLSESLKAVGASVAGDMRRQRVRDALVITEMALACAVLAGSGLVLKSLWKLLSTDPGFDARHVLTVQLSLPEYKYDTPAKEESYRGELLRRIAAIPGVVAVGGGKTMPLHGGGEPYQFSIQDPGRGLVEVTPTSGTYIVTTGYFQALSIPLLSGRVFGEKDFSDHRAVVMVNRQLAQRFWPGESAVGKFLNLGKSEAKFEVIGIVGDVKNQGLNQESGTAIYFPESRAPRQKLNLFVRTNGDPLSLAATVRRMIHDFEPDQAVNDIASLQQVLQDTVAQPRFLSAVLGAFGSTALLLGAVGIFGVISYNVRQRTREIGIRMAVGADRHDVLFMILRRAMLLIAVGVGAGLAMALLSGRLLRGLLYGVGPADPLALAAALTMLGAVALCAALIPARRATQVDPIVALRYE
jgi:putative ABC transport system permease protein